jgi:hypothetical protein
VVGQCIECERATPLATALPYNPLVTGESRWRCCGGATPRGDGLHTVAAVIAMRGVNTARYKQVTSDASGGGQVHHAAFSLVQCAKPGEEVIRDLDLRGTEPHRFGLAGPEPPFTMTTSPFKTAAVAKRPRPSIGPLRDLRRKVGEIGQMQPQRSRPVGVARRWRSIRAQGAPAPGTTTLFAALEATQARWSATTGGAGASSFSTS